MRKLIVPTLAILTLLVAPLAPGRQAAAQGSPEPAHWRTQHSMLLDGQRVEYDAVVGSVILRGDDEEPTGELFYTAYFRTGVPDAASRPIVFAYNGGPGSASFWLHMGIMGPKRVVTPTVGPQGAPPYPLVDKQETAPSVIFTHSPS